jgi:hypothetical protein
MGKCKIDGCNSGKIAYYGNEYKKPIACSECRKKPENIDMVNVKDKRCIVCLKTRATIGYPDKPVSHCNEHRLEGMIGNKKKCVKCKKYSASFGLPDKSVSHCASCKTPEMESEKKKCIVCNKISAGFGLELGKITHCSSCKTPEMFNTRDKKCVVCNLVIPHYGYTSETHCFGCMEPDMKNVFGRMCIECGIRQPNYSFSKDEKPEYCGECKKPGMTLYYEQICFCGKKWPSFGINTKRTHCFECKTPEMMIIGAKRCIADGCNTHASNYVYKGFCLKCFIDAFPDSPLVRNQKTKELAVVEFIKKQFSDLQWIFDKRITGGTSKRRPDIFLHMGEFVLIIEIDENQHIKYCYDYEDTRLREIHEDVKNLPIILIKYNPDRYIDENHKKIKSCWTVNKETGIIAINDIDLWNERLELLRKKISYFINTNPIQELEVIELFYDKYDF